MPIFTTPDDVARAAKEARLDDVAWYDITQAGAALRRLLYRRGVYKRRERVPPVFWLVVALHLAATLFFMIFPFAVTSRHLDGVYIVVMIIVSMHWTIFRGECLVSVMEKKLLYENYTYGEAPLHQWFVDVFPPHAIMAMTAVGFAWMTAAVTYMFLRNTRVHCPTRIELDLGFGNLGRLVFDHSFRPRS